MAHGKKKIYIESFSVTHHQAMPMIDLYQTVHIDAQLRKHAFECRANSYLHRVFALY